MYDSSSNTNRYPTDFLFHLLHQDFGSKFWLLSHSSNGIYLHQNSCRFIQQFCQDWVSLSNSFLSSASRSWIDLSKVKKMYPMFCQQFLYIFFCFICCIRILHWNCKSVQYIHNEIRVDLSNVLADSFFDKVVRNGHRQEANARIQVQKPPLRKVLLHWGVQCDGQHAGQATAA